MTRFQEDVKENNHRNVTLQLSVGIIMRGIGVGSPEKLAAAHLDMIKRLIPFRRLDWARLSMTLPLKTRFARFRRGAYPDSITPRN